MTNPTEYRSAATAARNSAGWRKLIDATRAHGKANDYSGDWFGAGEFRFFDARLHGQPVTRPGDASGRTWFVGSIRYSDETPREFKVYAFDPDGGVDTISDHASAADALAAMRFVAGVSQ